MSYSRWSNSRFYTFWCSSSGMGRDEKVFDVCGDKSFTYKELKDDIEGCLRAIRGIDPELRGYMNEFIVDVESDEDTNLYEELRTAPLEKLREILKVFEKKHEWTKQTQPAIAIHSDEKKLFDSAREAVEVESAGNEDIPLLTGTMKTEIGIGRLMKRLKGVKP